MGRVVQWRRRRVNGELFNQSDARETPIYSVTEAAEYIGVPRSTLRHWLKVPKSGRAIIESSGISGPGVLSFYNLLEAHVLRVALRRDVWLQRVRLAVETLRERYPQHAHPLLVDELYTAGGYRNIFTRTLAGEIEDLSRGGQLAFRQLLGKHLQRIDRDQTGPYQVRPYAYTHIAINHRVSGGRPVVRGTGILVETLATRARAGETLDDLARNYRISRADVREAIKYAA